MVNEKASHVDANRQEDEQNAQANGNTLSTPVERLKSTTSFRRLMEKDGHVFKRSGESYTCCCPFHQDSKPSFSIFPSDTRGHCFGCGWKGDIFDYAQKAYGASFREALEILETKVVGIPNKQTREIEHHKAIIRRIIPTKHRQERERYIQRLRMDAWMRSRVCDLRAGDGHKWNPDTIKLLADEGSLGWAGDALAFLYSTGTKYRKWPGKKMFWDETNIGNSLWRAHRLADAHHIYLTEGETDAITLVDVGMEKTPGVAVVSVPGASSFTSEWAHLFTGKNVTLAFDSDDAGQNGMQDAGNALTGTAARVSYIDLREVLQ